MKNYYLDKKKLAELVRFKRGNQGLREIAEISGISLSTLSRIENEKTPDMDTFIALCNWLEIHPAELIKTKNIESNNLHVICSLLKTDSGIDIKVANALVVLIEEIYAKN